MYRADDVNVAVRFIRRDVFLEVGGLDTSLIAAEDYDLHNRISKFYPVERIDKTEIHVREPKSLLDVARKHYYYGKTISRFVHKNRLQGVKQLNPARSVYLRH